MQGMLHTIWDARAKVVMVGIASLPDHQHVTSGAGCLEAYDSSSLTGLQRSSGVGLVETGIVLQAVWASARTWERRAACGTVMRPGRPWRRPPGLSWKPTAG